MPAAVAVPLIVGAASAGASMFGASRAADASKKAARTQSDAANKALNLQKEIYQNQQQLMSPYVQGGQAAFANMQRMAGGQGPMPPSPPVPLGQAMSGGPPMTPRGIPLGQAMGGPMQMGGGAPMGGPPEMDGGMVTIAMPDGSTQQMPRSAAQPLLMRGAQIVG